HNKSILVVGDLMIDVYNSCYTEHSRPSPERSDKLVYNAHRSEQMLGGAGNVAANLASLGVQTSLLSVCGTDGNAVEARRLCDAAGVTHYLIEDASRQTTVKTRLYIDDQYILRIDGEDQHKISLDVSAAAIDEFNGILDHVDAVILSDYNKGFFVEENAQSMIAECRKRMIPVVVDLKPPNASIFADATVVAPNLKEAREICNDFDPYQKEASLHMMHDVLRAENVVVTIGRDGMLIYDGVNATHVPGLSVTKVDSCGCGDTVRACMTFGLISDLSLHDAAVFANVAASMVVQRLGTATLTREDFIE
ncbi:MAG: bifunctional ADP-heptose synthase, partial [Kiritimatiellaceae bacterium]|nr:bifunctional ADP-heptose synthase [Kiritimatiellaceae bacterium]